MLPPAHLARPGVLGELVQECRREPARFLVLMQAQAAEGRHGQRFNVLAAAGCVASTRSGGGGGQPGIDLRARTRRGSGAGRDKTYLGGDQLLATEARDLALLEHAEE